MWTMGDLAVLTMAASEVAEYCEYCEVVPIADGDRYCSTCADEVAEYLAVRFDEKRLADGGLY